MDSRSSMWKYVLLQAEEGPQGELPVLQCSLLWQRCGRQVNELFILFSRSAEHSEFLIESEAQSAESLSDVTRVSVRAAQADANFGQGFYSYQSHSI